MECMCGRFGEIVHPHIQYLNRNNVLLHLGHRSRVNVVEIAGVTPGLQTKCIGGCFELQ